MRLAFFKPEAKNSEGTSIASKNVLGFKKRCEFEPIFFKDITSLLRSISIKKAALSGGFFIAQASENRKSRLDRNR